MAQVFYNNIAGNLSGLHALDDTTLTLQAGHNFPDPGSDYYLATLALLDSSARETAWEIVRVTDVTGNVLTVLRAQEGTPAREWASGSRIEVRLTAGATESKANLGTAAYTATTAYAPATGSSVYAPLASPALTGNPTAPTPTPGDNDTSIATTAFVNAEIAADAAPLAHVGGTGAAHGNATTSVAGFMAAADKTKLDGLPTMPVGTIVGTTDAQTLSAKTITALKETKTTSSSYNFDLAAGNYFTHTASANNLTVSNVPASGTVASFIIELTNGGAYSFSFWSGVKWAGGTVPTLTASGVDILGFYTHDGGTTWRGLLLARDSK